MLAQYKKSIVFNFVVGSVLVLILTPLFAIANSKSDVTQAQPLANSNSTMVSTCRFENKLVIISDTIDRLYIQLAEIKTHLNKTENNVTEVKQSLEQFKQALNETYRPHFNSLIEEKNDTENDLSYIIRYRREIHQSLSPLVGQANEKPESSTVDNLETTTDDDSVNDSHYSHLFNMSDFVVNSNFTFEGEWRKIILNCLYHYQVLTRIIQFENFIQREMPMLSMISIYSDEKSGWLGSTASRRWQCLKMFVCKWLVYVCELMKCLSKRILSNNLYLAVLMMPFLAFILLALLYKSITPSQQNQLPITIVHSQTHHRKPRDTLIDY